MTELASVDEVVEFLGGTNALAKLMGKTAGAVSQWRNRGLPPDTFLAISGLLIAKGATAPAHLWGMAEIVENQ